MRFSTLKNLLGRDFYIVNYHSISGVDTDPYINKNVYRTVKEFEEDISYCARHFTIISAVDLIERVGRNKSLPKDSMVITFDDGLRINYDFHLPILKKCNATATFFLNSAFVDNVDMHFGRKIDLLLQRLTVNERGNKDVKEYLSDNGLLKGDINQSISKIDYHKKGHLEEIAKLTNVNFKEHLMNSRPYLGYNEIKEMLSDGFSIGAHSIDHPNYGLLSLDEQVRQTVESTRYLEQKFDLKYRLFAFPYDNDTLQEEFYRRIRPYVDLTFGMGGFINDPVSSNLQRSEVESTRLPTELALKYKFLTSYVKSITKSRNTSNLKSA